MANNLDQQKEMNELLKQQNKLWAAQEKNLKNQTALMIQLVSAMKGISFKEAIDQVNELNSMLEQTSELGTEAGTNASDAMREVAASGEEALDSFERMNPIMGGIIKKLSDISVKAVAVQGAMRGFSFSIDMFKNVASGIAGLVSSIFQIGVAILSIPFRMWDAFLNMTSSGSSEWRQQLEEVRKAFGDLTKNSAADLLKMERNLNGVIAETGLSTYRIFGNRAKQLEALRDYATKLGAAFNVLSKSIASSASETERFAAYMKGLGMSDVGIKGVGQRAVALGTTVNEIGREITTFAFQVGDAFGINGRTISADIGEMIGDVANFGTITVKEMTQAAVFTRKLGLEFKAILGTIEAFDNFDKAAEGAAQLSQAFGMNIDAMQMIREEDPAARFETLRRAFFATGKSVESMTRQERALLAAQTGLTAEAVQLGFASKNQAMSYDQVQKAADGASKKQLTQEEAMQKLANSIDRLIQSGSQLQGGFIQHFLAGFERGIRRSKEFRDMFWAIRRALRDTFWAGAQVGRMFVDVFPGVKQFFGGIARIFDRNRFRDMLASVKQIFFQFFNDITKDPQQGVQKFLNALKDNFFNWFSSRSSEGMEVLDGLKNFFKAIIGIITQLGRIAIQGLIDGIKAMVRYIKNPTDLGISEAADGFMGTVIEIFGPLWEMLVEMAPQLKDAIVELFNVALDATIKALEPYWEEYKWQIIGAITLWFAGPAVIGSIAGAFSAMMLKGIGIGLSTIVRGGVASLFGRAGFTEFLKNLVGIRSPVTDAVPRVAPGPGLGFWASLKATIEAINSIKIVALLEAGFKIAVIIAFLGVGMFALVKAIMFLAETIETSKISASSILLSTLVIGAAAAIIGALTLVANAVAAAAPAITAAVPAMLPLGQFIAGFIVAAGVIGLLMYALAKGMTVPELLAGSLAIGVITLVLTAMIPLAIATALLGAAVVATGGAALIAAMIGLGSLAGFAVAAIGAAGIIIAEASTLDISGGIKEKVELVVSVITALISLTSAIGTIVASAAIGTIFGTKFDSFTVSLNQTTELVRTIKNSAIDFVNEIKDLAGQITPEEIKNLEPIISIMESLGNFLSSIASTTQSSLVAPIADFVGASASIDEFNIQMDNMLVTINGTGTPGVPGFAEIVKNALNVMEGVEGTPEQIATSSKALGDVLTALGGFMQSVASVGKGFESNEGGALTNIRQFIVNLTTGLLGGEGGGVLGGAIKSILENLTNFARGLTGEEVKRLEPITKFIGPLFTTLGDISKAVSSLGGGALSGAAEGGTVTAGMITSLGTMFTSIFDSLRDFLPTLITNLNTTLRGIDTSTLGQRAKNLTPVFALITTVNDAIGKFYWTARNAGGGMANWETQSGGGVAAGLGTLRNLFRNDPDNPNNFFTILRDIIDGIKTHLTPELLNGIDRINIKNVEKLKTIMEAVNAITDAVGSMKGTFLNDQGRIGTGFSGAGIHNMLSPIASVIIALTEDTFSADKAGATSKTFNELLTSYRDISTDKLSNLRGALESLGTVSPALSAFKTSSDSIVSITGTDIINRITPLASTLIALSTETYSTGARGRGRTLPAILTDYSSLSIESIANATAAITGFIALSDKLSTFQNSVRMGNFVDNTWMTNFFGSISEFSQKVATVNNDLINLAQTPINIAANLERIVNSLGSEIAYKVDTGSVNFTVNLSVTLKADDIADVLIDKEFVVPGTKGSRFVNGGQ